MKPNYLTKPPNSVLLICYDYGNESECFKLFFKSLRDLDRLDPYFKARCF